MFNKIYVLSDKLYDKLLIRNKTLNRIFAWLYKHVNLKIFLLILVCFLLAYFLFCFFTKSLIVFIVINCLASFFVLFYINFFSFVMDEIEQKTDNKENVNV